jgi:Cdc6-like AAA superfamily ATPase
MSIDFQELQCKRDEYAELCENAITMVTSLQNQEWSLEQLRELCAEKNITFHDAQYQQCQARLSEIRDFNYPELLAKLNAALAFGNKLRADNDWRNYNAPYIAYIGGQIEGARSQIQSLLDPQSPRGATSIMSYLSSLFAALNNTSNNLNPNLDELFEHFKYGNKNYVVFGKNGSGKTTLLRKIATDVFNHVIPEN